MFGECGIAASEHSTIPTVTLRSTDGRHSCSIFTYGATILSWICNGEERLFVSKEAILNGTKAVRGGIPLVFPQFGQPNPAMAQHGFARNLVWEHVGSTADEHEVSTLLRCKATPDTLTLWPQDFCLLFRVSLSATSLVTEFTVANIQSNESFQFQCLQHTYLQIPHITTTSMQGLQGRSYIDKMRDAQQFLEEDTTILVDKETDRVYLPANDTSSSSTVNVLDTSTECTLVSSHASCRTSNSLTSSAIEILQGDISVLNVLGVLSSTHENNAGTKDVDVVVWNPWIAKAKALVDLNDDGYFWFVCVEPGCVSSPVSLDTHCIFSLTQTLTIPV